MNIKGINKQEFEHLFNEHIKESNVTYATSMQHFSRTQNEYNGNGGIIKTQTR